MNGRERTDIADRIKTRISLNVMLIGVCITSLFFISGFNPLLLKENLYLVAQLVCAVPLLLCSVLIMSGATTSKFEQVFLHYANAFQTIGYAFVINAMGILVSLLATMNISLSFFGLSIIIPLVYSGLRVKYDGQSIWRRARKDIVFIAIVVLFGIRVI